MNMINYKKFSYQTRYDFVKLQWHYIIITIFIHIS